MNDIKTAVQKLAGTYGKDTVHLLTCSVNSADEASRTCIVTPVNDNLAPFTAYLMAETDNGLLIIPSAGSTVIVLFSGLNAPLVIQYSHADKMFFTAGGSTFQASATGVQLMGSSYGGLVEVAALTTKLNNLENDINNLKTILTAIITAASALPPTTPVPGSAIAALYTPLAPYTSSPLATTLRTDMENTNVQHGAG